jgi:xanthine dehydrogenase accessory factor
MIVLIRGGGDLASGIALRLYRAGLRIVITELPEPLAVRRLVSFSEAVYNGETSVEGISAKRVNDPGDSLRILNIFTKGQIPVLVDPEGIAIRSVHPTVVVDARMLKKAVPVPEERINLLIGLGPGFTAGANCHAAVETNRGHTLGRVYWTGGPQGDTGIPDAVQDQRVERVLRAPADGELVAHAQLGDIIEEGQLIAEVGGQPVLAKFRGALRGLLRSGLQATSGLKIGDLDPRADSSLCWLVSDKSLAVAGGVMEAILSRPELRKSFWS